MEYYYPAQAGYPPGPPAPMMQQPGAHHMPPNGGGPLPPPPHHHQHLQQPVPPPHLQHQQQQHHHQHHHQLTHQPQQPPPHQQPNYNHQQLPPMPLNSASPHQTNIDLQPSPRPSTASSSYTPHMHQQSPHQMAPGPSPIHQQQQVVVVGGPGSVPPPPLTPQHLMPTRILTPQPQQLGVQVPPPQMQPQMQPQMHQQNYMSPRRSVPPPPAPNYHISPAPHLPPHQQQSPLSEPHHNHHHIHQVPPHPPPHTHHQQPPHPHPGYMSNHPNNIHPHPPQMYDRGPMYYQNISQTELRIIELNKRLQNRPRFHGPISPLPTSSGESYWWERFASDFFDDEAKLTLRIAPDDKPVEYSIGRTLIPRFFKSYFDGGVVDLSVKIRNARESMTPKSILLECDHTDITSKYNFKHSATNMPVNVVVHTEGHLSLEFLADSLLIKSWRFYTHQCHEYIDRSMTATVVPSAFLVEPVTKQGLTTSTISYLKMCMIMEPMQELMLQHRQTQKDPRSCLKQLLFDKYKLSTNDDRPQPNKRRKRKAPANGASTGGNKKTKANAATNASININNNGNNNNNNNIINNNNNNNGNSISSNNNMGYNNINNNGLMSPSTVGQQQQVPNLTLSSQDVMTVGEPSMLGTDFGDENERRITRLENNEFESSTVNANNNDNNTNSTMMLSTSVGLASH